MRTLTAQDAAHILQDVTTWAVCWRLEKGADVIRQTSHDRDIEVSIGSPDPFQIGGTYETALAFDPTQLRNSADLAVDNLEVDTVLDSLGITAADVRAGLFDDVQYVLFLVNWKNPTNSGFIVKRGLVGNIRTFAREIANAELRGLKQYLQQTVTETFSAGCRADLGDTRCKVNLAPFTVVGTISSVQGTRLAFTSPDLVIGSPATAGWWIAGKITFLSGNNAGYSMEIRDDDGAGALVLFEPMPRDIQVGDTFSIYPGCNKIHTVAADGRVTGDCKNKFDNVINFRGEPFIPGQNELLRGPE